MNRYFSFTIRTLILKKNWDNLNRSLKIERLSFYILLIDYVQKIHINEDLPKNWNGHK